MTGGASTLRGHEGDTADPLDRVLARLLTGGTWLAVGLLTLGVVALLAAGRSPLEGGPPLDLGSPPWAALPRPEGFLWPGLAVVIATPAVRVAVSLVGYLRRDERVMALVASSTLGIIALSIALAVATEG